MESLEVEFGQRAEMRRTVDVSQTYGQVYCKYKCIAREDSETKQLTNAIAIFGLYSENISTGGGGM
jgi:hypothetical protein